MQNKLRSWVKLLDVQKQILNLAEVRLDELIRQRRMLEEEQRELLESFSSDDRLAGLFLDLRARRSQSLSRRLELMRPAIAAAEACVLDHAKRRRGIELKVEAVRRDLRHQIDRHELNEIIEAAATRTPASLP